ncbi:MAG TPA: family 78 glycoside hydrolase catalytic domain [Thermotogota bacterium]|nr:family 78 glycoside hydrolase catalytic domain [Thermotogota bacterium]
MLRKPFDLKCDLLREPVGMDCPSPVLQWNVESERRGACLAACEIELAHDPRAFFEAPNRTWKSGWIPIDAPECSDCLPELEEHSLYFWRVRCRDNEGNVSDFSDPTRFATGFLRSAPQARWITSPQPEFFQTRGTFVLNQKIDGHRHTHALYLRKEFALKGPLQRAVVYFCGLGYGQLEINGQKVGDHVLDPAQSEYDKAVYFSGFDVTHQLRQENALVMILGNGRFLESYGFEYPRGWVELRLEYRDGTVENVLSDTSWVCIPGEVTRNGIYCGETHDSRRKDPSLGLPGADVVRFPRAIEVEGILPRFQNMEPIRVTRLLAPRSVHSPAEGTVIFDFGQNFAGWVRLTADGPRGTKIRLRFSELLAEDGSLNMLVLENAEATDEWILRGEGEETFEPLFTYHGFRYVEVTGYPGVPRPDQIVGCVVHSDVEAQGSFFCSNELVNRIHECVQWGQRSNLMSIPTDCPQRDERHGWLGDAHLAGEESLFNFGMHAFYRKYLDDISRSQQPDGSLSDVVPSYYRFFPADPAWGSAYVTLAWETYQFTGDAQLLAKHFPGMQRYVDFLGTLADGGIITFGKYGDWCPPGSILPKRTPVALTSTWFYFHDALILSKIAQVLGQPEVRERYEQVALQVRDAFHRAFFQEDQYAVVPMSPRQSLDSSLPSQTSNALPLSLEMVPPDARSKVFNTLVDSIIRRSDYHVDTGIVGTRFILDVLSDGGRMDVAWKMVKNPDYPGWGYMVNQGATTLWERWEKLTGFSMNSHNHIMLGSVDGWLYKYVAGMRPLEAGWAKILFQVPSLEDIRFASASVKTPRGKASVSWKRRKGELEAVIRVPVSAKAQVRLPLPEGAKVWEGGREVFSRTSTAGIFETETASGLYRFRVAREEPSAKPMGEGVERG